MKTMLRGTLLLGAALAAATALPAWSQTDVAARADVNLETLDCRTMLKMDSEDREFTLVFFHGLISGRQGTMVFQAQPLAEATDRVLEQCIDSPDETLLAVFEKARKG